MKRRNLHWALLGCILLTILLTYPIAFRPTELMLEAGAGNDAFIFIWNMWWVKTALFQLQTNPYITDFIFFPDGTNLALHTLPLPGSILGAVLSYLKPGPEGLFLGYNLVVLLSFVLGALGTYLLVYRLTGSRSAAFVSGIVFAFTHYRFSNTVRLHCLETGVLPFTVWALVAMVQDKRVWRGCLVGLFAALTLYSSKEYFAQLLIGIFLGLVYLLIRYRSSIWNRLMLLPKLAAAGVFILLCLPLLFALGSHGLGGETGRASAHAEIFSADVLDFLVPNPRHPLFGDWSVVLEQGLHGGEEGFGLALPLVALMCAIWAVVTGSRERTWPWAALGIVFLLLSLGPVVHLGGHATGIPSVYRGLTALVPWLEISRTPMRFIVGLQLILAILVGFALAPTPNASPRRLIAATVIAVLLVFETLSIPLPMTRVEIHPYYRGLAGNPARAAVLELPPRDRTALKNQIVHGKKIPAVRRVYPRAPQWSLTFWTGEEFRGFMETLFRPEKTEALSPESLTHLARGHRRFLTGRGIRFVTVAKTEIPPAELDQALTILREMSPERVYEDERLAAFEY